ncbi:CD226 antigen isoform X3 [Eucyclogobius newberryi]|uniref:CD226 antigen isoform X3 n=1 Tax=Eucyclogobius newberryi TaxID=166745 RepID=UPI003B5CEB3B
MGAVNKDHWYFMVLLFLPIVKVRAQQKEPLVTLALEEGMVLDCVCPWSGKLSMVSWTKGQDKNPIAVLHPDLGVTFSHQYRERVEFLRKTALDGSIALRNVTHQDIGLYHCSVQTFPQGPWTSSIQVEDLDEPPAEDDEGVVDSEYSTPEPVETSLELLAELNENLTLSCSGLPNVTVYQVIMEKRAGSRPWFIIAVCKIVNEALLTEDYSERGSIHCAHTLDVSLHLVHVQQEDSGFYRCTFHTETGTHNTTMTLSVSEPAGGISLSVYMFYIYCAAGTAGLLLLIAIIIVVVRHRHNNKRIEYRVKKRYPKHRQPNIYENISVCRRGAKRPRHTRKCPVYTNLQYV